MQISQVSTIISIIQDYLIVEMGKQLYMERIFDNKGNHISHVTLHVHNEDDYEVRSRMTLQANTGTSFSTGKYKGTIALHNTYMTIEPIGKKPVRYYSWVSGPGALLYYPETNGVELYNKEIIPYLTPEQCDDVFLGSDAIQFQLSTVHDINDNDFTAYVILSVLNNINYPHIVNLRHLNVHDLDVIAENMHTITEHDFRRYMNASNKGRN